MRHRDPAGLHWVVFVVVKLPYLLVEEIGNVVPLHLINIK
jgi:hypothetical protein